MYQRFLRIHYNNGIPETDLEITKFATPNVEKQFIHLDQLPDGSWRLLFNVDGQNVPDIESFELIRVDND